MKFPKGTRNTDDGDAGGDDDGEGKGTTSRTRRRWRGKGDGDGRDERENPKRRSPHWSGNGAMTIVGTPPQRRGQSKIRRGKRGGGPVLGTVQHQYCRGMAPKVGTLSYLLRRRLIVQQERAEYL